MRTRGGRSNIRGGMGDWWSDLAFNWNPANAQGYDEYFTPVANIVGGVFGVDQLGNLSSWAKDSFQDLATGTYGVPDPKPAAKTAPTILAPPPAPAAGTAAPAGPFPWLAVGGLALVAAGGTWYFMHKKKGA